MQKDLQVKRPDTDNGDDSPLEEEILETQMQQE